MRKKLVATHVAVLIAGFGLGLGSVAVAGAEDIHVRTFKQTRSTNLRLGQPWHDVARNNTIWAEINALEDQVCQLRQLHGPGTICAS